MHAKVQPWKRLCVTEVVACMRIPLKQVLCIQHINASCMYKPAVLRSTQGLIRLPAYCVVQVFSRYMFMHARHARASLLT